MAKHRRKHKSKFFPILILSVALATASWVFSSIVVRYLGFIPAWFGVTDEDQINLIIFAILLVVIVGLSYMLKKRIDYSDTVMDIADG